MYISTNGSPDWRVNTTAPASERHSCSGSSPQAELFCSITCGWIRKNGCCFGRITQKLMYFCSCITHLYYVYIEYIYYIYIMLYLDWWYVENWRLEARVLYINKLIICGQTFRIHQLKGAFCWSKFEEPFSWKHHETAIWSGSIGPNHPKCCIKCSGKKRWVDAHRIVASTHPSPASENASWGKQT